MEDIPGNAPAKKQAAIVIDATKSKMARRLGWGCLAVLTLQIISLIINPHLSAFSLITLGTFTTLFSLFIFASGHKFYFKKIAPKKIAKNLEAKGFAVQIFHTSDDSWKNIHNFFNSNAGKDAVSLFLYSGHGEMGRKKGKSAIFFRKSSINSEKFVAWFRSLEGQKIAAVDACESGGFAANAEETGDPNIAIFTSSGKKTVHVINPFMGVMLRMARSKKGEPFASEFFRLNGKISGSRKKFTKYSPQSYIGKNMAQVKL
ncbi:MAG: caspase family protein [Candidatus Micrarchaeia archaeon]